MSGKPRVLCVDDEANILKAIQRSMRKHFHIVTADGGREALQIIAKAHEPFHVIISDMKMPEMNGAQFLKEARRQTPDSVRILLTGFAEIDLVTEAINEGHIYRFIGKPCSAAVLLGAINDAVRQNELLTAEKVLLEQTLKGCIMALTEILSLASPEAFGRATRIRQLATVFAREVEATDLWQIEVAALLSQIGAITLPQDTAQKLYQGEELDEQEQTMVERIPDVTEEILLSIPRLDPVLETMRYVTKNWDGTGTPKVRIAGEEIPQGARILKVAMRCEELQTQGYTSSRIHDDLHANAKLYEPALIKAYKRISERSGANESVRGVTLLELRTGMLLTEEVRSTTGVLLVASGQEVTVSMLERIQNYHDTCGLQVPMWVMVPEEEENEDEESVAQGTAPAPAI